MRVYEGYSIKTLSSHLLTGCFFFLLTCYTLPIRRMASSYGYSSVSSGDFTWLLVVSAFLVTLVDVLLFPFARPACPASVLPSTDSSIIGLDGKELPL